jgi:flagellar biosynthesis/type III secretory pathway chaperone
MARSATLDDLEDLLDRERAMILEGRITDLERHSVEKARLSERLVGTVPVHALARLRSKADRNQALLEASASGIRSALQHLKEIRCASSRLETYAPDGARVSHGTGQPTVRRRA